MNLLKGTALTCGLVCLASGVAVADRLDHAPPGLLPAPIADAATRYDLHDMQARDAAVRLYELYHRATPDLPRRFAQPALGAGDSWALLGDDYTRYVRQQTPVTSLREQLEAHVQVRVDAAACDLGTDANHVVTDAGSAVVAAARDADAALLALGRFTLFWAAECDLGVRPVGADDAPYTCTIRWTLRDRYAFPVSDAEALLGGAPFGIHGAWSSQAAGRADCSALPDPVTRAAIADAAGAGAFAQDLAPVVATRSETSVALRTVNGHFLTAPGGGGAGLDAIAPAIGPWETFALVAHDDGTLSLRSGNGLHVRAENGGGAGAQADRWAAGAHERFTLVRQPDGRVALQTVNGHFLVAEGGGGGAVNANRGAVGAWETFTLVPVPRDRVALRADDGRYVAALGGGGGGLVADRAELGPWESFTRTDGGLGRFALQAGNGQHLAVEPSGAILANRWSVGPWELFLSSQAPDGRTIIRGAFGTLTARGGGISAAPASGADDQRFDVVALPGLFPDWSRGAGIPAEVFAPDAAAEGDACLAALPAGIACSALTTVIADGLRPAPVAPGQPYCVCAVAQVEQVTLTASADVIGPGEETRFDMVALDARGEPVIAQAHFPLQHPGLRIDGMRAEGIEPGDYFVTVQAGLAFSEPLYVLVSDPRDQLWRTIEGRVDFPDGLAPPIAVVVGPDGRRAELDADGRFTLDVRPHRNQRVSVVDDRDDTLLLSAIVQGEDPELPPTPITVDLHSTAEALVFLSPTFADPEPMALEGFRALSAMSDGLPELESRLLETWVIDGSPLADLNTTGPAIQTATVELRSAADALLRPSLERPAQQALDFAGPLYVPEHGSAFVDPERVFAPRIEPQIVDGIKAEITRQRDRVVRVRVSNLLVRRLDLYLEEVLPGGGRPAKARTRRMVGGFTGLPTISKILAGFLLTGNPLSEAFSPGTTDLNLALPPGTSWRIFSYGPGALGSQQPRGIADPPEQLLARVAKPMARTFMFDVLGNLISVATTIDKGVFKLELTLAAETLANLITAGDVGDAGVRVTQGDAKGEFLAHFVKLAMDRARDIAKSLGAEAFGKVTAVLDVYDAGVGLLDLGLAVYTYYRVHTAQVFTVFDDTGAIGPRELPDAVRNCAYQTTVRVEGGEGPFDWTITNVVPQQFIPRAVTADTRGLVLSFPHFTSPRLHFEVEARQRNLGPDAPVFARREYTIFAAPEGPRIGRVTFPDHPDGAEPGETVRVVAEVADCLRIGTLQTRASGAGLAGISALNPKVAPPPTAKTVLVEGVVTVNAIQQDSPMDGSEVVKVRATSGGRTAVKLARLRLKNVAPGDLTGKRLTVAPGEPLPLVIEGVDKNWDLSGIVEIDKRGIRVTDDGGLATDPGLGTLKWSFIERPDPKGGAPGRFSARIDATRLAARMRDNDGKEAGEHDDGAPHMVAVEVIDDDGKPGIAKVPVIVRNLAPTVTSVRFEPAVLDAPVPGVKRPLRVTVVADDANGLDDIGQVVIDPTPLGLAGGPVAMTRVGQTADFVWQIDDVPGDCVNDCTVHFEVRDADDRPGNGYKSETSATITQFNLAPTARADGLQMADQSDLSLTHTGSACAGQLVRFSVFGRDPNGTAVRADLIFDGRRIAMTPSVPNATSGTFVADVYLPHRDGVALYHYEVFEKRDDPRALFARTPEQHIDIDICDQPDLSRGPCWPSRGGAEACNRLDDDCDGRIDEGLVCGEAPMDGAAPVEVEAPVEIDAPHGEACRLETDRALAVDTVGRVYSAQGAAIERVEPAGCERVRVPVEGRPEVLAVDGEAIAYLAEGIVWFGGVEGGFEPIAEGVAADAGFGLAGGRLLVTVHGERGPQVEVRAIGSRERLASVVVGPAGAAALGAEVLVTTNGEQVSVLGLGEAGVPMDAPVPFAGLDALRVLDGVPQWFGPSAAGVVLHRPDRALRFEPDVVDAQADGRGHLHVTQGADGAVLWLTDGDAARVLAEDREWIEAWLRPERVIWRTADGIFAAPR